MKNRLLSAAFFFTVSVLQMAPACADVNLGDINLQKSAQQIIAGFQSGDDFNSAVSTSGLVREQRIDKSSLSTLAKALATSSSKVRRNIIKVLEKVALDLDEPRGNKFLVVRDKDIIRTLAVEGFAKEDSAAEYAAKILDGKCMPSDLATLNDLFARSLQLSRGEYLVLATKAKTIQAKAYVDHMATMSFWRKEEAYFNLIQIAQAALGNSVLEDEFIQTTRAAEREAPPAPKNRFYDVGDARDGSQLAMHIADLGRIGTSRSLAVVCSYLRSDMKSYVAEVSERSIRYAALDAIRYNYPDEKILFRPTTLADWNRAENFCRIKIGAEFIGATPDFAPEQAYPR